MFNFITHNRIEREDYIMKPRVKLIGEDGNIFSIMGRVTKALKREGLFEQAKEYSNRIFNCGSYSEALSITMEYVDVE
jgi:hypothetical protein